MAKFRGRSIWFNTAGYPQVTWPGHPVASGGWNAALIHRIIAFEEWGEGVLDKQIHHKNEDLMDWRIENLEPLSAGDHNRLHANLRPRISLVIEPQLRTCSLPGCGNETVVSGSRRQSQENVYCSVDCCRLNSEVANWPPVDVLVEMVKSTSFLSVGRTLGVSDNAIRKRLKVRGKFLARSSVDRAPVS